MQAESRKILLQIDLRISTYSAMRVTSGATSRESQPVFTVVTPNFGFEELVF
jgi:hypothetical protein